MYKFKQLYFNDVNPSNNSVQRRLPPLDVGDVLERLTIYGHVVAPSATFDQTVLLSLVATNQQPEDGIVTTVNLNSVAIIRELTLPAEIFMAATTPTYGANYNVSIPLLFTVSEETRHVFLAVTSSVDVQLVGFLAVRDPVK